MFRLWCFCGWGKVKTNPIPIRCPRCGKKLHVISLANPNINKLEKKCTVIKKIIRYKLFCKCGYNILSRSHIAINCPKCGDKLDVKKEINDVSGGIDNIVFKYRVGIDESDIPKSYIPKVRDEITIGVPQGIGDIFWIYQQFVNYFNRINFVVYGVTDGGVQNRAKPFLRTWPKVGTVEFGQISPPYLTEFVARKLKVRPILYDVEKNDLQFIEYISNAVLNAGNRIDEIDPELDTAWDIDLPVEKVRDCFNKYILIYISGGCCAESFSIEKWDELITKYQGIYGKLPVVFLGAKYDKERILKVRDLLKIKYDTKVYINRKAEQVYWLIKNADYFFSIQSGLCILADNFNTPLVMFYHRIIPNLKHAWPKRHNLKNGVYTPVKALDDIDTILGCIKNSKEALKCKIL